MADTILHTLDHITIGTTVGVTIHFTLPLPTTRFMVFTTPIFTEEGFMAVVFTTHTVTDLTISMLSTTVREERIAEAATLDLRNGTMAPDLGDRPTEEVEAVKAEIPTATPAMEMAEVQTHRADRVAVTETPVAKEIPEVQQTISPANDLAGLLEDIRKDEQSQEAREQPEHDRAENQAPIVTQGLIEM